VAAAAAAVANYYHIIKQSMFYGAECISFISFVFFLVHERASEQTNRQTNKQTNKRTYKRCCLKSSRQTNFCYIHIFYATKMFCDVHFFLLIFFLCSWWGTHQTGTHNSSRINKIIPIYCDKHLTKKNIIPLPQNTATLALNNLFFL
jgi:Na+/melibiose symporter-like transporter